MEITKKKKKLAVGLMSGTSLDGVDACIVEIENNYKDTIIKVIDFITIEYKNEERERILKLCNIKTSTVDEICYMNVYLGNKMADAAVKVCKKANIDINNVDFISSHGQTIYHMPQKHGTLQIGELANIASLTGCVTIGDFRPSDMAYCGQGAPLVPYVDYIMFSNENKGRILLNLGGIGNVTVLKAGGSSEDVWGFDTGPANILINYITKIITNGECEFDEGGKIALSGEINEDFLKEMLENDIYLDKIPPKSTGREYYTTDMAKNIYNLGIERNLEKSDILATVTAYTAKSVENQLKKFVFSNCGIHELYVSGGGAHNKMIMNCLDKYIDVKVKKIEDLGMSSDSKEAVAFAILGNEFLHGYSNNIPSVTGANRKVIMGKLTLPSKI